MKNQKNTSKLASFAKNTINQKEMTQVKGGQWYFWGRGFWATASSGNA